MTIYKPVVYMGVLNVYVQFREYSRRRVPWHGIVQHVKYVHKLC